MSSLRAWSVLLLLAAPFAIAGLGPSPGSEPAAGTPPPGGRTAPGLQVVATGPISDPGSPTRHVEPWLAVDPADPDRLIAAAMLMGPEEAGSGVWASADRGATWRRARREDGATTFPSGDPMAVFGADGAAYFTTLAEGFSVWRSVDGGLSWERAAGVPGGSYDRQWLAVDRSGGPHDGRLYAAGKLWVTVFDMLAQDIMAVSRSDDGARSFTSPQLLLPRPDQEILQVVSDLAVAPDGTLLVPFQSWFIAGPRAGPGDGRLSGRHAILRSEDGGRSFEGPFEVGPYHSFGHARQEQMLKALGGGRLAVDRSDTPSRGRLYLAWAEAVGEVLHILVAASGDGGRTWSEAIRTHSGGLESSHSNPAVAVNEDGVVAVTWNDRRDDPDDACFRTYGAVSRDGGRTFAPEVPLADSSTCPGGGRWANGGDTQGLVALPGGDFLAAWIHAPGRVMQLWHARLRPADGGKVLSDGTVGFGYVDFAAAHGEDVRRLSARRIWARLFNLFSIKTSLHSCCAPGGSTSFTAHRPEL